jgi:parallel beta-helix repeat protein
VKDPRKLMLAIAAAILAAGLTATVARPAETVSCGDVITEDTTLGSDLTGCEGTGLVVAGTNVTLDLGGHTVSGTGNGFGIEIRADGVTVRNGTVSFFGAGIDGEGDFRRPGPTGVTIRELTITANVGAGIGLLSVGSWLIDHDVVLANGRGIFFARVQDTVVSGNLIAQNDGNGFQSASSSDRVTVSGNRALHNGGDGISVSNSTTQIVGNRASFNGGNGVVLHDVPGFPDVIADNVADDNGQLGIVADFPGFDGGGNAAKHNGNPLECVNVACAKNAGQAD